MRGFPRIIGIILMFAIAAGFPRAVNAQEGEQYFPETGYTLRGDFLDYYNGAPDALLLFGYPISEELIDSSSGRMVQYFQRARFERVQNENGGAIELSPLGKWLYDEPAPLAPLSRTGPACRAFDSGFSVCYSFLHFYDTYQGEEYFGQPISAIEIRDGRYVQYFERVRMEWRPEAATGEVVGLTDLGRIYADATLGSARLPRSQSAIPGSGSLLQLHAFVAQPLLPAGDRQTLYVVVQDQEYQPVEGAMVTLSVQYPDESQFDVHAPSTDEHGISRYSFTVDEMPVREVVRADVDVYYEGTHEHTATWFRIWW